MSERAKKSASEFCKIVESPDLLSYLGLNSDASSDDALGALKARRKRLQSMQNNPKFRESAMFLVKNFRALQSVLEQPAAHLDQMREEREERSIPTLRLVIGSVLSDGALSTREEAYARRTAEDLGVSTSCYERLLSEMAASAGVLMPKHGGACAPDVSGDGVVLQGTGAGTRTLRGASGHGWWDATFTRLLLETVPGGPGEAVDLYCRKGLSAQTLLPERPQLSWVGVDRDPTRLQAASEALAGMGRRVVLTQGAPDRLPLGDESVDYVLAIRALANLRDTEPVFREAMRVLRPGGRFIVAEPDGLGEAFYFGGHLGRYNRAFHSLQMKVDLLQGKQSAAGAMGKPGIALGAKLPERLENAGFNCVQTSVHASNNLRKRPFSKLTGMLRKYPVAVARAVGLGEESPDVKAVIAELGRLERQIHGSYSAVCGHVLPMFLCVGEKPVE